MGQQYQLKYSSRFDQEWDGKRHQQNFCQYQNKGNSEYRHPLHFSHLYVIHEINSHAIMVGLFSRDDSIPLVNKTEHSE